MKNTADNLDAVMHEESEDVFYEGVSSRFPDIMSVGLHSPGGPNGIIRSQSFAGFSTLQERRSRCNSFIGNSVASKKPQSKPKKIHTSGHKASSTWKESQPKRVEEVYEALKHGLIEYLEVHQVELDKLTPQMKDMKRNSRLGVLYDLDKQIKTVERYVRRLEFHISKVDELYEAFCIQRRLRDGACKMKQAFAMSPSTKAARESLVEINRRYKEYSENMCTFEGELENLLGEFHIKMKGLAGFARLCPGDQYEIFIRYGRQRWKLKGKIEVNARQSWDGEEMIFLPLITDLISIKVTELKGLATHILVGSVICETKDLFTARPQVVAVDINDLGTIKLNLEVTWYPFDVEDLTLSSTGNANKAAALQRRVSVYSQGTPETPTFEETSFFSALPDDVFENGISAGEKKCLSLSFNELPNGHCTLPPALMSSVLGHSNPEITVTPPENDSESQNSSEKDPSGSLTSENMTETESEQAESLQNRPGPLCSEHRQQLSSLGPEDVFLDSSVSDSLLQDSDEASELKPVELDTDDGNLTKQLVKRLTSVETLMNPDRMPSDGSLSWESDGSRSFLDGSLEDSLQGLLLSLETHKERFRELQDLEQEVMRLEDLLKPCDSLQWIVSHNNTVAELTSMISGHPQARGHLSEALTEDTGVGNSVAGSPLPLTTGNESLDITVVKHLQYCSQVLQQLVSLEGNALAQRRLLEKLTGQTLVLENLGEISTDRPGGITSAAEAIPALDEKKLLLSFWEECSGPGSVFHASVDRVMKQMHNCFAAAVQEKYPGGAALAIRCVVNEMMDRSELVSTSSSSCSLSPDVITIFQFHNYMTTHGVSNIEDYLIHTANEVLLVEILHTAPPETVLRKLQEVEAPALQPRQETLRVLASLLNRNSAEVSQTVAAFLKAAGQDKHFREKAVLYYTEALSEPSMQLQMSACVALRCLKATESIDTLVSLCKSANEELGHVAAETLLTFGENGRLAYEQLDKVPHEMIRLGTRRGNVVTTAF
ncbi:rho family-interacting cell polarization regulator 2 isoform X3 [Polyodon spathula]|uniref:rho family-interacting cell polarization regulator 2 isoform X3 n=1 Tax=Polyodon spathula TaxID=7913 RepID=UPI001B7DE055|nr:rho family-interacting cell polarization regulator 2 isoform X3 [Polyodon spathula]